MIGRWTNGRAAVAGWYWVAIDLMPWRLGDDVVVEPRYFPRGGGLRVGEIGRWSRRLDAPERPRNARRDARKGD